MARGARWAVGTTAVVLVLGAGGYAAADAVDAVPGWVTLSPPPPTPAPFPTPDVDPVPEPGAVVGYLDPAAPLPSADGVQTLARALVADPRTGASTSVLVADVLTGEVLADVGGDVPQVPASTTKLLTAVAAVTALGTERTLPTRVVQAEPGRVVLVGGGDMLLGAGPGIPDAVNGHAGLTDLAVSTAQALLAAGATQVSLGLDDSLFAGPAYSPTWEASYIRYVAPVAALAVNAGRTNPDVYAVRHADPALEGARLFATLLAAQGVTVVGGPVREAAPAGATQLAAVESAPMRDLVRYMVQQSDNTVAEALGRLVAVELGQPGSFEGATRAVLAQVAAQGVDVTGAAIRDCSGLDAASVIPARVLVDTLVHASAPGNAALLPVVVDLPVGGWQGTLNDRFGDGAARGLVRAKTGSLPGVTSLAGTLLTQEGRLLAFAVLADATGAVGQDRPRAALDAFVTQLAAVPSGPSAASAAAASGG